MICNDCSKGKIVMSAFSNGNCIQCNCDITTPHIPCDKVCIVCSEEHSLCKECGKEIE